VVKEIDLGSRKRKIKRPEQQARKSPRYPEESLEEERFFEQKAQPKAEQARTVVQQMAKKERTKTGEKAATEPTTARAEREAWEKAEAKQTARAEREAREQAEADQQKARAEREAREKAEAERKARAERKTREKAETEQTTRAEWKAGEKAEAEQRPRHLLRPPFAFMAAREAREKAEAEQKARAEWKAGEKAEAERKARVAREAREKAEAEQKAMAEWKAGEKAEAERKARVAREAREQAEADQQKARAEREAREKAEAERKARAERKTREKAETEQTARAELERLEWERMDRDMVTRLVQAGPWTESQVLGLTTADVFVEATRCMFLYIQYCRALPVGDPFIVAKLEALPTEVLLLNYHKTLLADPKLRMARIARLDAEKLREKLVQVGLVVPQFPGVVVPQFPMREDLRKWSKSAMYFCHPDKLPEGLHVTVVNRLRRLFQEIKELRVRLNIR
jgi:hypothetical protein